MKHQPALAGFFVRGKSVTAEQPVQAYGACVAQQDDAMKYTIAAVVLALGCGWAWAHGGGCRKDSPPGQCCHMDRKAGTVHCH